MLERAVEPRTPRRHRLEEDLAPARAWVLGLVVDPDGFVTNASCVRIQLEALDSSWSSPPAVASTRSENVGPEPHRRAP